MHQRYYYNFLDRCFLDIDLVGCFFGNFREIPDPPSLRCSGLAAPQLSVSVIRRFLSWLSTPCDKARPLSPGVCEVAWIPCSVTKEQREQWCSMTWKFSPKPGITYCMIPNTWNAQNRQVYIDRELFCSCLGLEGWENGKWQLVGTEGLSEVMKWSGIRCGDCYTTCGYTTHHWTVHFKRVNFVVCGLYFSKVVYRRKVRHPGLSLPTAAGGGVGAASLGLRLGMLSRLMGITLPL